MEKKGKNTLPKVMKMLNLKTNPIMASKAQDILFVSNAGIQMKHTKRMSCSRECNWERW